MYYHNAVKLQRSYVGVTVTRRQKRNNLPASALTTIRDVREYKRNV